MTTRSPLHRMLEKIGTSTDFKANSKLGQMFRHVGVRDTPELQRIRHLPKRDWKILLEDGYREKLSAHLRRPGSKATLLDVQVAALTEFYDFGGFLGNIGLGEGKCVVGETECYDPQRGRFKVKDDPFARVIASDEQGKVHSQLACISPTGTKECRKVFLRDGTSFAVSDDHPVRTQDGWIRADKLTTNHLVAVARRYPAPEKPLSLPYQELEAKAKEIGVAYSSTGMATMRLPPEWYLLSEDNIRFFLTCLWDRTGHIETANKVSTFFHYTFKQSLESFGLMRDLRFLFARLGILTRQTNNNFLGIVGVRICHESDEDFMQLDIRLNRDEVVKVLASKEGSRSNDVVPIKRSTMKAIWEEEKFPKRRCSSVSKEFGVHSEMSFAPRDRFTRFCESYPYDGKYAWLTKSDYVWVPVQGFLPIGAREVYDVSVPTYANFFGNGALLHNTLITGLAPTLIGAKRPVLLAPGALRQKTANDFRRYRDEGWLIHPSIEFVSYEMVSRNPTLLFEISPDSMYADEVQHLKSLKAACTKRVARLMAARPDTLFLGMSGTLSTRSLMERWHLFLWSHGSQNMPIPKNRDEAMEWALATDEKVDGYKRVSPGMLLEHLGGKNIEVPKDTPEHEKEIVQARMAIHKRLDSTAAYISTSKVSCNASLSIEFMYPEKSPILDDAIAELRDSLQDKNGDEMVSPSDVWAKARMMSCGFYYKWVPQPPTPWLEARRNWFRFVRMSLDRFSRRLDTPLQVAQEVDRLLLTEPFDVNAGKVDEKGNPLKPDLRAPQRLLGDWRNIQETYEYKIVPEWLDLSRAKWIANTYLKNEEVGPYIVWVEHIAMGQKLSELSGRPFHHQKGLDANKNHIENARGPIIASIEANYRGFNLQAYHHNFIVSCIPSGKHWEQLFGRTHRQGQTADHVYFKVMEACPEHKEGFVQVLRDAHYVYQIDKTPQRLLLADKINW